ncbi:tape measure protein [Fibrella forsythiae]|uniref:Tape measure protein N-terminal domain-containing protein n=1 Tax=Fibrella forsythiae TaxID=2817061 RepID=A0ABS3JEG0_9BACT|nr:tape measure protein [Fibrella forsythiae]MBO0947252.1 hypothetical protein [Fibrella forsythiae]
MSAALDFDLLIRDANWNATLTAAERRMIGFSNATVRETSKIDSAFASISKYATTAFAFAGLSQLPQELLKVRGEFQQLEISFSTMLRSKEKADKLFGEIRDYALVSPSSVKESAQVVKQLLAYGSAADSVISEVKMLGDVAAGTSQPLGEIAYLYGTLKTQGRAYAQDIRQFAGRGIGIYAELAKVLKINTDEVNDFVSAGKVGFKEVEQAFKNMTSGQGVFAGLTEAQSKSLVGLTSQLSDAWEAALNDIGKQNEGLAADIIKGATTAVQSYQQLIDTLQVIAAAYGTYRAAQVLASVAQLQNIAITRSQAVAQAAAASSSSALSLSQIRAAEATSLMAKAQRLLNTTLLANPYALAAALLAGLVTAYFAFRDETQQVKSAQELLADASKNTASTLGQQRSEIGTLIGVLKNQNVAESERLKAYNRLKEISPDIVAGLDFQRAKTADLTKSVEEYITSLRKKIQLEAGQGALKAAYEQDAEAGKKLEEVNKRLVDQSKKISGKRNSTNGPEGGGIGTGAAAGLQLVNLKRDADAALAIKKQAEEQIAKLEGNQARLITGGTKDYLANEIRRQQDIMAATSDKLSPNYKRAEDAAKSLQKQLDDLAKTDKKGQEVKARGIQQIDKEIKAQKELLDTKLSEAKKAEINQKIADLQTEKANLQGKKTPAQNKAAKAAEKVGEIGSQSYWENEAKIADEALKRIDTSTNTSRANRLKATKEFATQQAELIQRSLDTPVGTLKYYELLIDDAQKALGTMPDGTSPEAIATQRYIITQAREKADEIEKRNSVKTFSEELEEKKSQYALYQRWVDTYGKEAADSQFTDLKKSGDSYVDYLNAKISELQAKQNFNETDAFNVDKLIGEKNSLTGVKTPIELFVEFLDRAKAEAATLTDYLEVLEQQQAKLGPADYEKKVIVADRKVQTKNDITDDVRGYLESVAASEEQINSIRKHYAYLRTQIIKQANGVETSAMKERLAVLDKAESDQIAEAKLTRLKESDEWKAFTAKITSEGRQAQIDTVNQLRARIAKLKDEGAESTEDYREALADLAIAERELGKSSFENLQQFAGLAGELGQSLAALGGTIGSLGSILSGLASNFGLLNVALKDGASKQDQYAAGLQSIISLIDIVTSSSAQRAQAEAEFARNRNEYQQQYNLLLNEQIGIQSQQESSIFLRDYAGELNDNFAKYRDAQLKYQTAIAKLNEGKAKTGQKNATDLSAVAKGAVAGATLGIVLPGVGNVVGGIVGGLIGGAIGLFGGKKKQDEYANLLQTYPELLRTSANGVREVNQEIAKSLLSSNQLDDNTKQLVQNTLDWAKAAEDAKKQIESIITTLAGDLAGSLRSNLIDAFKSGEKAADAMAKSVSESLESVLSQLIFNRIFADQFKQLESELTAAFDSGGDLTGVYGRFFEASKKLSDQFDSALDQASKEAQKAGFNIFQKEADKKTPLQGGGIASISESTASVIEGEITALRINGAQGVALMRESLLYLSGIKQDTANIDRNTENLDRKLDKIVDTLKTNPLYSKGLPG